MKKWFKRLFYISIFLLIGAACLIAFLCNTTPGLYTCIRLGAHYLPGTLKVHALKGRLRDRFTIGALEYEVSGTKIILKNLSVDWNIHKILRHTLSVRAITVEKVSLNEESASSSVEHIRIEGHLYPEYMQLDTVQFQYQDNEIHSTFRIDTHAPFGLSGTIHINPEHTAQSQLSGTIALGGDAAHLQWTGTLSGPADISIEGDIEQLSSVHQVIKWRNAQLELADNRMFKSPEGRITLSGTLPFLEIHFSTKMNDEASFNGDLHGTIKGTLPWQWQYSITAIQSVNAHTQRAGLSTTLTAKGAIQAPNQGTVTVSIAPGHYQLPEDSLITAIPFNQGLLEATLSPKGLSGTGSLALDTQKNLNYSFTLPKYSLISGVAKDKPIRAKITLLFDSLDFLNTLSPEIKNIQGQLHATLSIKGTLEKLRIKSTLELKKARASLPALGLDLNPVSITCSATKNQWHAQGTASVANKTLLIEGSGTLQTGLKGRLSLHGEDIPIMNTKEYQIHASPNLHLDLSPKGVHTSGTILIPYADIKPHRFSNSLSASEDVVFLKDTQNPSPNQAPFASTMDVQVLMGDAVALNVKGLSATLGGAVTLTQRPQSPITATGELTVKQGAYKAYGQDLSIEQGALIFTGGAMDNPGISLRASKTIKADASPPASNGQLLQFNSNALQNAALRGTITVGVEVSGRLNEPKIQLFSNPALLSQADILSMLVLGRPANQASKAGGQLLLAAISSMNLGSGSNATQLLEQLKQSLGFDFDVQTNSNFNLATNQVQDATAVVVGKSLSKRIYLSYNVGISPSDPNVLTLKYLLNTFFSIQVSSSTIGSGIDFMYTSSNDSKTKRSKEVQK